MEPLLSYQQKHKHNNKKHNQNFAGYLHSHFHYVITNYTLTLPQEEYYGTSYYLEMKLWIGASADPGGDWLKRGTTLELGLGLGLVMVRVKVRVRVSIRVRFRVWVDVY